MDNITKIAHLMGQVSGMLSRDDVKKWFAERDVHEREIEELQGQLDHVANAFYTEVGISVSRERSGSGVAVSTPNSLV